MSTINEKSIIFRNASWETKGGTKNVMASVIEIL